MTDEEAYIERMQPDYRAPERSEGSLNLVVSRIMTPQIAIEKLDDMQRQIIHGSRIFGDIADVIRNLEAVRLSALMAVGEVINGLPDDPVLNQRAAKTHRILACCDPAGMNNAPAINSENKPPGPPKPPKPETKPEIRREYA